MYLQILYFPEAVPKTTRKSLKTLRAEGRGYHLNLDWVTRRQNASDSSSPELATGQRSSLRRENETGPQMRLVGWDGVWSRPGHSAAERRSFFRDKLFRTGKQKRKWEPRAWAFWFSRSTGRPAPCAEPEGRHRPAGTPSATRRFVRTSRNWVILRLQCDAGLFPAFCGGYGAFSYLIRSAY